MRSLSVSNCEFDGVKFTPRQNSLNKFFAGALKLQRSYTEYEATYIDTDTVRAFTRYQGKDDLDEWDKSEFALAIDKLARERYLCYQTFLTCDKGGVYNVNNAENLCKIMFEDCNINHSQDRDAEQFQAYLDFMISLLKDFFLNFNPMRSISALLQNLNPATPLGTNSPKANLTESEPIPLTMD